VTTRRHVLARVGLLTSAGMASLGFSPDLLFARKKKKHKKKPVDEPLDAFDWLGTWSTTLSNGVTGIANFGVNGFLAILGTYTNSVGSGTFTCEDAGERGASLHCLYEQTSDGTSGGFSIALTDKNHWFGSYFINQGGGSGTWAGVRN
jgi:hypothetical protein